MNFEEISEKAYRKEPLDEINNIIVKYAYYKVLDLYRKYDDGKINLNQAREEKQKLKKEYEEAIAKREEYYDFFRKQTELKGKYHDYIVAIEKAQNEGEVLMNSLLFIEQIIGDSSFSKRNYKKVIE